MDLANLKLSSDARVFLHKFRNVQQHRSSPLKGSVTFAESSQESGEEVLASPSETDESGRGRSKQRKHHKVKGNLEARFASQSPNRIIQIAVNKGEKGLRFPRLETPRALDPQPEGSSTSKRPRTEAGTSREDQELRPRGRKSGKLKTPSARTPTAQEVPNSLDSTCEESSDFNELRTDLNSEPGQAKSNKSTKPKQKTPATSPKVSRKPSTPAQNRQLLNSQDSTCDENSDINEPRTKSNSEPGQTKTKKLTTAKQKTPATSPKVIRKPNTPAQDDRVLDVSDSTCDENSNPVEAKQIPVKPGATKRSRDQMEASDSKLALNPYSDNSNSVVKARQLLDSQQFRINLLRLEPECFYSFRPRWNTMVVVLCGQLDLVCRSPGACSELELNAQTPTADLAAGSLYHFLNTGGADAVYQFVERPSSN